METLYTVNDIAKKYEVTARYVRKRIKENFPELRKYRVYTEEQIKTVMDTRKLKHSPKKKK